MSLTPKGKIFFAKAVKGYTLKVMIDSLSMVMSRTTFRVSKKGFFHRAADEATHVLFDVEFPRSNFRPYVCRRKKDILFSLNLKHLQKLVRNVKKKDSIIMYISARKPNTLVVVILPCGLTSGYDQRSEELFVTISKVENEETVELPELSYDEEEGKKIKVYGYPKVIDASAFQKVKKIATIGKIVSVEMQKNNYIAFSGDRGELYGTQLIFGKILDDPETEDEDENTEEYSSGEDEDESSEEEIEEYSDDEEDEISSSEYDEDDDKMEDIKGWYKAKFNKNLFEVLFKLPGLCSQMEFYSPKVARYPLKVRMLAGTLGYITVYLKDTVQIDYEQSEKERKQAEVNSISRRKGKK